MINSWDSAQILIYKDDIHYAGKMSSLKDAGAGEITRLAKEVSDANPTSVVRILVQDSEGNIDAFNPETGTIMLDPIAYENT